MAGNFRLPSNTKERRAKAALAEERRKEGLCIECGDPVKVQEDPDKPPYTRCGRHYASSVVGRRTAGRLRQLQEKAEETYVAPTFDDFERHERSRGNW